MSEESQPPDGSTPKSTTPKSKTGWDGKLRVNKQAVLANPEALSDPEYSDEDAPPPEQIDADEGVCPQEIAEVHHADELRLARGRGSRNGGM